MNIAVAQRTVSAQHAVLDSFLAISRLSLTTSERLSELNAAALREAFTDSGAVVRAFARITLASDLQDIQTELVAPLMQQALAYSRNVREVVAQTQNEAAREATRLMQSQLSGMDRKMAVPESWEGVLARAAALVKQPAKSI